MRRIGAHRESTERLRSLLRCYELNLVTLEIGRRGAELVWIATVLDGNRVTVHTVSVEGEDPHTKAVLRSVMRAVVEARAA